MVCLYQTDTYFDIRKIFFLCVIKIAVFKIHRNKHVQSKLYFHFFGFIIFKLLLKYFKHKSKILEDIFTPCRFNKC